MLGILLAAGAAFGQAQSVGGGGGTIVYYVSSSADGGVGTWQSNGSLDPFVTGHNVGIGTAAPAAGLHLLNRNALFEEANVYQSSVNDVGYAVTRVGLEADLGAHNPTFSHFRINKAGVNLPAEETYYYDTDNPTPRKVGSFESSGTRAAISNNARVSFREGFGQDGAYRPTYRDNAYPDMRHQQGAGGFRIPVGSMSRTANVVTATNAAIKTKQVVGATISLYPGETLFPQGDYTVASCPDEYTITFASAGTNGTNTATQNISSDTDVEWAREAKTDGSEVCAVITVGGHYNLRTCPNRVETDSNILFKTKGAIQQRLWFNGGGQSQLNDSIFLVNSGSGDTTSTLPSATTLGDGYTYIVKNTATNHVVVSSTNVAENIDNSPSKTLNALQACMFISGSNNWWAFCSP